MSNQRPANVVRALEPNMRDMTVLKFFKMAQQILEANGKEDEAFYLVLATVIYDFRYALDTIG